MLKVLTFVALDVVKHVDSTLMEVLLKVKLFIGQEVDQRSLFNEVVFLVEA